MKFAPWRTVAQTCVLVLMACGRNDLQRLSPDLLIASDVIDFGPVAVLNEKTLTLDLNNQGRGELTVYRVQLMEDGTPFELRTAAPSRVGGTDKKTLEVAFTPPREMTFEARLEVETDDPSKPLHVLHLTGVGSTRAQMTLSPAQVDFGRVPEGTSALKSFTVKSVGSADLRLDAIEWMRGSSSAFSFAGSVRTPAVVKTEGGTGALSLSVLYTVSAGAPAEAVGQIRVAGTDPDLREAWVDVRGDINRAPTAVIAPLPDGRPGMTVTLDGRGSMDPDGDVPLSYRWTLEQKPLSATTVIAQPTAALTSVVLDPEVPGEYGVMLEVTDAAGAKGLSPARARIVARPTQALVVEMFWDNVHTDLDLHFLRGTAAALGTLPDDCHYANAHPDWGLASDATDDPAFLRDALSGFGPEVVAYDHPATGTYRVLVQLQNPLDALNPASVATVRIYDRGVLTQELKRTLVSPGEVWSVADIDWPSGETRVLP